MILLLFTPSLLAQHDEARAYYKSVLAAYGSTPAVQSLHTYHLQGVITLYDGESESTGQVEVFYKHPDRYKRVVTLGPDTEITGVRAGVRYRVRQEAGAVVARQRLRRGEGDRLLRFLDGELCNVLALPAGAVRAELKPDTLWVGGTECDVLKIEQDRADSAWIRLLVDAGTHLIRRVEMYVDDVAAGTYTERWLEFDGYAARGAIQFPGVIREYTNGTLTAAIQVESVEFNVALSDNVFKPE